MSTASPRSDPMESVVARLYERFGARVVRLHLAALSVAQVATVLLAAGALARYLRMSSGEALAVVAVAEGALIGIVTVTAPLSREPTRAILKWDGDQRSLDAAVSAWHAVASYPGEVARRFAAAGTVAVPLVGTFAVILVDESGWALVPVIGCGWLALAGGTVLLRFALEFALRPILQDVAGFLPPDFEPDPHAWSVRAKVLGPVPVLIVFAAVGIGAFVDLAEPGAARIAVTAAIGVVVAAGGTVVFVAVIRSVLDPIRDLTAATERVRTGDLTTGVPVVTSDDLGALAASFNRMLEGLRERDALREEVMRREEELRASRARIVAASDAERRRVERNIHDGAQQQLVGLAVKLRMLEERVDDDEQLQRAVAEIETRLKGALQDLRELARGLHPSVLSTDGLAPALQQLASHAPVPVTVAAPEERFPEAIESTAYFVACEALANVAKYAQATRAEICVQRRDGRLVIEVADDGIGGAHADAGSGLTGLLDRVSALDGTLSVVSPTGQGTRVIADLPIR